MLKKKLWINFLIYISKIIIGIKARKWVNYGLILLIAKFLSHHLVIPYHFPVHLNNLI